MAEWKEAEEFHDRIAPYFAKDDGTLLKWVLVAEVHDGESKKLVSLRGPVADAIPIWDAKGMLRQIADDEGSWSDDD